MRSLCAEENPAVCSFEGTTKGLTAKKILMNDNDCLIAHSSISIINYSFSCVVINYSSWLFRDRIHEIV